MSKSREQKSLDLKEREETTIANDAVVKVVCDSIINSLVELKEEVENILDQLNRDTLTVGKLMEAKKSILRKWIDLIPLNSSTCYYCMKPVISGEGMPPTLAYMRCRYEPGMCEYGKAHGNCIINKRSDYNKISDSVEELETLIEELYW